LNKTFADIATYPVSFWLLTMAVIAQYSAIYPTFFFVSNMLTTKFAVSPILAGSLFGLIHLTAAVLLPSIGNFVDRYGGITKCMVLSAVIGIVVNLLWLWLPAE
jgi:nitrate/nitrite transporter NarK